MIVGVGALEHIYEELEEIIPLLAGDPVSDELSHHLMDFGFDLSVTLATLVALWLTLRHVARNVISPLENVTDAVERLSTTGQTGAIPEARRTDEIGTLARAIASFGEAVRGRNQAAEIRLLTDNLPALIIYVDAERVYRFANRMAADWYGRPVEDIIGRRLDEVMSPASYARLRARIEAALAGTPQEFEAEVDHAGRTRAIEGKLVPDRGPDGIVRGYFGFGMDVSAQRQADTRLRLIADSLPGLITYLDAERRIRYANKTFGTWYQKDSAAFIGRHAQDAVGPEVYREVEPWMDATLAGQAQRFESGGLYPDGKTRRVDVSYIPDFGPDGDVRGLAILSIDVTAQRERDARLQLLTNNVPAHIAYIDAEGRFQSVNATTEAWYARPASELLGRRPSDLLAPGSYDALEGRLERAMAGERQRFEATYRYPDGIERTVDVSYVPEFGADGTVRGCFGLALDISEQRANAKLLQIIANDLPALLVYIGTDGRFRFVNKTCEHWYARPAAEIVGQRVRDVLGEGWYMQAGSRIEAALAGERSRWTGILAYPDGKTRVVDLTYVPDMAPDGEIRGMFALSVDVTDERAAAEQARLIADNLPVMVNYVDRDCRYRFVNKLTEEWYGRSAAEIVGKTAEEVLGERYAIIRPHVEAALAGETRLFGASMAYPDGRTRDVEIRYVPDRDPAGHVRGFYGIVIDVTERKTVEEQLRQMQKMESVGQLSGGIAHDFNNLLAVVIGSLDLLAQNGARSKADAELIREARDAARKGADLTKRLLSFARKQQLRPQPTDVETLITETMALLGRVLGEHVRVETSVPKALWPVFIDRIELETAIINLAVNARDAMPGGGTLSLKARNVTVDPASAFHASELAPRDYVALMVTDGGTGMPETVKARAFDPFFTTKETGKGTGLGLSMVYGFAKQSGGGAEIDSQLGVGTTVTIYLPRATTAPAREAMPAATPAQAAPRLVGLETILVVDDNRAVRDFCVKAAERLGYTTISAGSGAEAMAALSSNPAIGILLTDIIQPGGMNGIALAQTALRQKPGLKVVYMSGFIDQKTPGAEMLPAGAVFLGKPFQVSDLADALVRAGAPAAPAATRRAVNDP